MMMKPIRYALLDRDHHHQHLTRHKRTQVAQFLDAAARLLPNRLLLAFLVDFALLLIEHDRVGHVQKHEPLLLEEVAVVANLRGGQGVVEYHQVEKNEKWRNINKATNKLSEERENAENS